MSTRFNLVADDRGRISFCLVGDDDQVLLQGLPCRGKIDAQTEVMHTREVLRADHLVPHEDDGGNHFVVLKDDDGNVLARSPHVAAAALPTMVQKICDNGPSAAIIDRTRH